MLFSQRMGLESIKDVIQIESMDNDLRTGLWNVLEITYWRTIKGPRLRAETNPYLYILFENLWLDFFKAPLDDLKEWFLDLHLEIRNYFFGCKWEKVYDFIEFVSQNHPNEALNIFFRKRCNSVLEKELSAYRFVDENIVKITEKEEILEIEKALGIPDIFKGVKIHLKTALNKLADKKSPDYRNSIKESISAIESLAKIISGQSKAELKDALNEIERKVKLHPALKDSFIKLYGYTSDSDGIRHALLDETNLNLEDAKFMLVSCSAFINYLITKSQIK